LSLYDAYVPVRTKAEAVQVAEVMVDSFEPINWGDLINRIVRAGISINKIGLTIGVSHETVRGWRDGSIPNYEAGRKLLAMAAAVAGIPVGTATDRSV